MSNRKFLGYMKEIVCEGCINFTDNKCYLNYQITIDTKIFFCKSYINNNVIFNM